MNLNVVTVCLSALLMDKKALSDLYCDSAFMRNHEVIIYIFKKIKKRNEK